MTYTSAPGDGHGYSGLAIGLCERCGTDHRTVRDTLADMIAEHEAAMARLRADKPTVTDGHSDGKRVRYVRHETSVSVLAEIAAMIASADR